MPKNKYVDITQKQSSHIKSNNYKTQNGESKLKQM